jgi:predicted nuclease of predicted toxin-antitoxin system
MKLLVDMNLSLRWVGLLTSAGFDAVHWSSVGPANAPGVQIMAHALANDCVVLTHDSTSARSLPQHTAKSRASCSFEPAMWARM